jgi:hypothetical protein
MEQQLSLHLKAFNDKVKTMNQTNSKELSLSALEARNIHAGIFELLTQIQALTEVKREKDNEVITLQVGGGKF